jgi:hypothetical protein
MKLRMHRNSLLITDFVNPNPKPSYHAVSTDDRTINPDLERFMARRMQARTIEVKASHRMGAAICGIKVKQAPDVAHPGYGCCRYLVAMRYRAEVRFGRISH